MVLPYLGNLRPSFLVLKNVLFSSLFFLSRILNTPVCYAAVVLKFAVALSGNYFYFDLLALFFHGFHFNTFVYISFLSSSVSNRFRVSKNITKIMLFSYLDIPFDLELTSSLGVFCPPSLNLLNFFG